MLGKASHSFPAAGLRGLPTHGPWALLALNPDAWPSLTLGGVGSLSAIQIFRVIPEAEVLDRGGCQVGAGGREGAFGHTLRGLFSTEIESLLFPVEKGTTLIHSKKVHFNLGLRQESVIEYRPNLICQLIQGT